MIQRDSYFEGAFGENKLWGCGAGYRTVTVGGGVFWAPAVNYYLWGSINRIVFDWLQSKATSFWDFLSGPNADDYSLFSAVNKVSWWRWAKNMIDGGGDSSAMAFTRLGWLNSDAEWKTIATHGIPDAIPCKSEFNGLLWWRVGLQSGFFAEYISMVNPRKDQLDGIINIR